MNNKRLLLLAMTSMSVFLFGTSLYGQQDVDPAWYNPWSGPSKLVAHPPRPQVAKGTNQPKSFSGLPAIGELGNLPRSNSSVSKPSHPSSTGLSHQELKRISSPAAWLGWTASQPGVTDAIAVPPLIEPSQGRDTFEQQLHRLEG